MVFRCSKRDAAQLFVMDIDDDYKVTPITPEEYWAGSFDIAPDGKTIYFSAQKNTRKLEFHDYLWEIFRIGIDGADMKQLTENRAADYCVAVSPYITGEEDDYH